MNREEKEAAVAEIAEGLQGAEAIFAVDYRGISVPQAAELRGRLAEADAVFSVVKNRLAKRALAQAGAEELDELFVGPTALTLIKGDPVTAAKAIATFSREHEILAYKGGVMDGAPLDPESFEAIARLPGLDVLHGQLVGLAASPLTGVVAGMSNLLSGLGRQLAQIAGQGLVSGEPPPPDDGGSQAEQTDPDPDAPGREAEEASGIGESGSDAEQDDDEPDAPGPEAEEASGGDSEEEE